MKKKILIALLVLAALSFGFYILRGERFQKNSIIEFGSKKTDINTSGQNSTDDKNSASDAEAETAPSIEVKPADCDNNCSRFKKDNEKEYCQEICGTTSFFEDAEEEGGSEDDCADEKGIQKDYCLKDIGVGNKDVQTCNNIEDASIKKSCTNRITEDILEQQGGSAEPAEDY